MTTPIAESRAALAAVRREEWITLGVILVGAAAIRLFYLGQPMRNDEAYSYLYFALPGLRTAVSDYAVPNNHIFHTVLVWSATQLFGHGPEVIRLPVLIAGLFAVVAVWLATRSLAGAGAALFAAAVSAALPAMILYSTNARAYMIICLGTMLLIWIGSRMLEKESLSQWAAFVVIEIGRAHV